MCGVPRSKCSKKQTKKPKTKSFTLVFHSYLLIWLVSLNAVSVIWHTHTHTRAQVLYTDNSHLHTHQSGWTVMSNRRLLRTVHVNALTGPVSPMNMWEAVAQYDSWRQNSSLFPEGVGPHSPLNWGRLFSLNAAKPSKRSLVGITLKTTIQAHLCLKSSSSL